MEPAIRVENLSKMYKIGRAYRWHDTLRDLLVESAQGLLRRKRGADREEEFWALRNVSFDIQPGEVVGIIGRNGAGKSTLLKILSRITEPTSGRAVINGRVGSLLEVGTGFHPELTGRDNIYLNGAILGMKRSEIAKKFDEIVAFAEIEKFLDTPVKRYSSGMYVRLAFAVAAHLEPEILLVDEVLAVGDAAFQKKCLGKMGEAAKGGRTVLFVSHNMAAIAQLCRQSLLLDKGAIIKYDNSDLIIKEYLSSNIRNKYIVRWDSLEDAPGDELVRLLSACIVQNGSVTSIIDINQPSQLFIEFNINKPVKNLITGFFLFNSQGICLFDCDDWRENQLKPGKYQKHVFIPAQLLAEDHYAIDIQLHFFDPYRQSLFLKDALSFESVDSDHPLSVRGLYKGGPWPGVVRVALIWSNPQKID
jgi:lipopolysaccharide transport system ATP-binding protein